MPTHTSSWIKNTFARTTYDDLKGVANRYIPIASLVLLVIFALTQFFYCDFLSQVLRLTTGASLIFVVYIIGLILFLDKAIKTEYTPDPHQFGDYRYTPPIEKPKGYVYTKIWGISLIVLGIVAIYATHKYRKHYAFKCETFLVDEKNGIYHIIDIGDDKSRHCTTKMKGYQIEEHGYTLCETCDILASDAESEYESERFIRR
jgi:hypothetical protein